MAKIVKNTTVADIFVTLTGVNVPASGQYTIPAYDYNLWVGTIDSQITAGTFVINDGTSDLSVAQGIIFVNGLPSRYAGFDNTANGFTASNAQAAIEEVRSALTVPLTDQEVFVSKLGNDTTGNGSVGKPYLTIAKALTSITDSSPTKRYTITVAPGDYAENLVLKANVFIKGSTPMTTRITGSTININDATWNNSGNDSRSGLMDITVNNVATWDFTAQAGNTQGKLYFWNIRTGGAWTTTGLNAINQLIIQDSELFGTTTFTGITVFALSTAWQSGNVIVNSSAAAGIPAIFTADGGMIVGNITATWTSNAAVTLNLAGFAVGTSTVLSASGASCTVNVNSGSLPIPANRSFTSSAVLVRVNDNFAKGLLSATTNVTADASAAPVAGQALVATSSTDAQWSNVVNLNNIEVSSSANATTTSGTDALLTTMSITPAVGEYIVWFSTTITSNNAGATITVSLYVNGVQDASTIMKISPFDGGTLSATTARGAVALQRTLNITAGAVEIRWSTSGGTATCGPRVMTMLRVG